MMRQAFQDFNWIVNSIYVKSVDENDSLVINHLNVHNALFSRQQDIMRDANINIS